jgi:murein DD-endopeptidase MepM/ murein hydrolase activator NlpD
MSEMSKGFDSFLRKLQQAEKSVERMAVKSLEFGKNIANSDTAVGKVIKSTGMIAGAAVQGLTGTGNSMMASSLSSFASRKSMNDTRDSKTFSNIDQTTKGITKRTAKKLGLGEFTQLPGDPYPDFIGPKFESGANSSANNALYSSINQKNKDTLDRAKDKAFKRFGLSGDQRKQFESLPRAEQKIAAQSFYGPQDTMDLMSNMATMWNTFLPDVEGTINRGAGYYSATNYMGNSRSRRSLENQTLGRFNRIGGLTSAGADANVAQYLTGRGMSANRDVYNQTINSVANAGRYMNIANETAAESIEGLTSASGSGKMLQNFGIYTADLGTGKEKTQTQIYEELAKRLTAGRGNASVEQTMTSIRRGALGVTIDSYFQGDTAGAQMFKQYMIERARGKKMDFASEDAYGQAGDNRNPLNAQMTLAASDTATMNAAEDSYVKGLEAAVGPLQVLNMAAGALAETFAGLPNALLQSITGHRTGKGIIEGINAYTGFSSKAISGITQAMMSADTTTPWSAVLPIGVASMIGASAAASMGTAMAASGAMGIMGLAGNLAPGSRGRGGSGGSKTIISGYGGIGGGGGNEIINSYGPITQELGNPNALYGSGGKKEGNHGGTDYGTAWGAPIKALADGTVQTVVKNHPQQDETASRSYGNHVVLSHPGGYITKYAHMSRVAEGIDKGKPVTRGQIIGYAGNSGYTRGAGGKTEKQNGILHSGTHLHLEVWKGSQQIDPSTLGPNALVMGSSQGVDPNSSLGQSIASSSGATSSGDMPDYASQALNQLSALTTPNSNMATGMSLLSQLYSGSTSGINDAIGQIGTSLGLTSSQVQSGMSGTYSPTSLVNAPSGLFGNAPGLADYLANGGSLNQAPVNNNVSIVVQVPDTSQSEALKFAKLVKSYLDSNSLMSNTGRT